MPARTSFVTRHPVATFAALTVTLSWATACVPLPAQYKAQLFPLIIICIPPLVGCALAALEGGGHAVRALLSSVTRNPAGLRGFILALGLPLVLWYGARGLAILLGLAPGLQARPAPLLVVMACVFGVSAAAEEIGWRGYALPRLLERSSPLAAGLLLGIPWAAIHLPLHLPGMMSAGTPVVATIIALPAMSVAVTWVYLRTGRSVLAATLFHAGQNFFGFAVGLGMSDVEGAWLVAVVSGATALIAMLVGGQRFAQRSLVPRVIRDEAMLGG